ncbi:TetR/AcrR family transcriptional regulator [Acinetobacter puyangensis]|uniref:TetR/AcrR family transcriptional regulator n=1 Tax=Acinetobacter puyangensis TaxID=1096779 RepID=UPI003A4E64CF
MGSNVSKASKSADKILSTAESLFNQQSFTAVGVDLIRDESGCSKTTMYTYFKNKNQLVQSVLHARDQRFRQALTDYIGQAEGLDALNKILDWHLNWFQTDTFKGCLFVRAVAEANVQHTEIIAISRLHKQWLYQLIRHYCNPQSGIIDLADLLYTLLEGLISRFLVDGYNEQIAQQTRQMFNQIFEISKTGSV